MFQIHALENNSDYIYNLKLFCHRIYTLNNALSINYLHIPVACPVNDTLLVL